MGREEGVGLPSASGRTPPHNLDAERSVLGGVLLKPAAFEEVATVLVAEDFFLPAHREIFDAILALDKRGRAIDVVALGDELRTRGALPHLEGGLAYLTQMADAVPQAENVGHYVRIVKERATLRRLITVCAEIQARSYGDFGDYEEFLDEAEKRVFDVAQQTRRDSYKPLREIMPQVIEDIEGRAQERRAITGVPTGFTRFDNMTSGLQPDNLIIVAARPGVGKTSFAVNVATNAALHHGIPVLLFSLEMSDQELIERMIAGEARIDSSRLRSGHIEYTDWKTRIFPASGRLAGAPILIDDSPSPTILEVRAKVRRFAHDVRFFPPVPAVEGKRPPRKLGVVVVDYLQLMRGGGSRRDDSREREIAEISRGLKALAKDVHLPIIAVSQLNRGLEKREDKRPQLSDLRESGAIEQDADLIAFIHRDDVFSPGGEQSNTAELIVGKHRNGPTGSVPLTFIRSYTKFENFEADVAEDLS